MKYQFSIVAVVFCLHLGFSQSIILPSITSLPSGWGKNNLELIANGGLFTNKLIYSGQVSFNPIENLSAGLFFGQTRTGEFISNRSFNGSGSVDTKHALNGIEYGGKAFYHKPLRGIYGLVAGLGLSTISSAVVENTNSDAKLKANTGTLSIYLATRMSKTSFYLGFDWKITKINSFSAQGQSNFINNVVGDRIREKSTTQAFCPVMALSFQSKKLNWGLSLCGYAETTKTNLNFSSQTFHFNIAIPIIRSTVESPKLEITQ